MTKTKTVVYTIKFLHGILGILEPQESQEPKNKGIFFNSTLFCHPVK